MPERIGFVGLGIMGRPMAENLAKKFDVVGFDVLESRRTGLTGVTVAHTAAEVAAASTVVCLSLPSAAVVEEVVLGGGGLGDSMKEGALLIDLSTSLPSLSRRIAARLAEKGIEFADAPVSGGEAGAHSAALAIMVGGTPETFRRCQPYLAAIGKTVVRWPPPPFTAY